MDYAGNSNKDKEAKVPLPEKNLQKVSGEVIVRKKPFGHKFKTVFFGGEFKEVVRYVSWDVVLPGIRDLGYDVFVNGARRAFYGDRGAYHRGRPGSIPVTSRAQYNNPIRRIADPRVTSGPRLPDQPPIAYRQNKKEANEIILVSRDEAESVLEQMLNCVDVYGVVSLADLYEIIGQPKAHTDQKWGWTDLRPNSIKQIREGYLLELPPMEEI